MESMASGAISSDDDALMEQPLSEYVPPEKLMRAGLYSFIVAAAGLDAAPQLAVQVTLTGTAALALYGSVVKLMPRSLKVSSQVSVVLVSGLQAKVVPSGKGFSLSDGTALNSNCGLPVTSHVSGRPEVLTPVAVAISTVKAGISTVAEPLSVGFSMMTFRPPVMVLVTRSVYVFVSVMPSNVPVNVALIVTVMPTGTDLNVTERGESGSGERVMDFESEYG